MLGSSGIEVGSIAYGCWRLAGTGVADASAKIGAALDAGLTLIDTADIPRFAALGVHAAIQPLWAYADAYVTDLTIPRLTSTAESIDLPDYRS